MRPTIMMTLLGTLPTAFTRLERPYITNTSALPVHFGVLVYPGFQALDAFSVVDVFNTLSMSFDLYESMHFEVIGEKKAPVSTIPSIMPSDFGQSIVVTTTYDEIIASHKPLDVLIIPGGTNSEAAVPAAVPFIKAIYPRLQYVLTTCVGATIAAQAGILDGRNATTSKSNWDRVIQRGPHVNWQRPARWVVDSNIWTGSGSAAGIDMALAWVGQVYGHSVAQHLSNLLEFNRAQNSTDDPFAELWKAGA